MMLRELFPHSVTDMAICNCGKSQLANKISLFQTIHIMTMQRVSQL